MILDDLFDGQQTDPQTEQAVNPIQQLTDRYKSINADIDKLKNVPAPTLAEPTDDKLGEVSTDILRGFFKSSMPPDNATPDFGQMFRQSVSPGRELLANMLNGVSSSLLGTKFQTVRDQAYTRFQETQKLTMERDHLRQQMMAQTANIAQDIYKQRGEENLRRNIEQARMTENVEERAHKLLQAKEQAAKLGIDIQKFISDEDQKANAGMQDAGPPLMKAAHRAAAAELKLNNVDINSPAGQVQLMERTKQKWVELEQLDAKVKADNRPPPQPFVMQVQGPDGNSYAALIDKHSGAVVGGSYVGRKMTAEQLDASNQIHNAASNLRAALVSAQNNPDTIGGFAQQIPPEVRARFGKLSPEERSLRMYLNTAVASYVQSISGKAVTDSERKFLTEGLPKVYESPEKFFPAASAFAGMLDASALRSQYGLDVDLTKPMQSYMKRLEDYAKAGKIKDAKIMNSQEFLDYALKGYGKKLKKGQFGTMEIVDDKE